MKYIIEIVVLVFIILMIINMIIIIYNTNKKNMEFFLTKQENFTDDKIEDCDEYISWIKDNKLEEWLDEKSDLISSKEFNLRQDIKKIAKKKFCKSK